MRTFEERYIRKENFTDLPKDVVISKEILKKSVLHCYNIIDSIDFNLISGGVVPLSNLVERANLSSLIGNVLGTAYALNSGGAYIRNKPNTYPDLISTIDQYKGIEIKTAYNRNCPKGHLPKEGYYLIYRYDLTDKNGQKNIGENDKWNTVTIWEIRFGYLNGNAFCLSSTRNDSGKTASINISYLNKLKLLYFDPYISPYQKTKQI